MSKSHREKLAERFHSDQEVDTAVKSAVRKALAEHKKKGNAIAVWGEGQVRIVSADDIQLSEEQ